MVRGFAAGSSRISPDAYEQVRALAERQAAFFRVLGNPQRVLIVWLLSEKRRTLDEIALAMGSASATAVHHVRILMFGGLVQERSEHGCSYYHIVDDKEIRSCLIFRKRPEELLAKLESL